MGKTDNSGFLSCINSFRAFDSLSEPNKKYLSEHAVFQSLKRGAYLWRKSDPGEFCAVIVEGLVEVVDSNSRGDDRIIGLFGPGEIIGLAAILKRSAYPASAIVSGKSARVLKLYIRSLELNLKPESKNDLVNWQNERLLVHEQILRDKISVLGAGRLSEKILELIDHLKLRFSKESEGRGRRIVIPIPISKTQIAKLVEARVETVIRLLNKWEKAGHIEMTSKALIVINIEKLRELEL